MHIVFATRTAARNFALGQYVDHGPQAPKGERYSRYISGVSGSAGCRRKQFRAMMRKAGV